MPPKLALFFCRWNAEQRCRDKVFYSSLLFITSSHGPLPPLSSLFILMILSFLSTCFLNLQLLMQVSYSSDCQYARRYPGICKQTYYRTMCCRSLDSKIGFLEYEFSFQDLRWSQETLVEIWSFFHKYYTTLSKGFDLQRSELDKDQSWSKKMSLTVQ